MLEGFFEQTRLVPFCAFLAAALLGAACPAPSAQGALLGLETIEHPLPFYDGNAMRDPREGDDFPPMRVLLSRSRYWAQDGHLEVVVQLDEDDPQGELRGRILGEGGAELSRFDVFPLPGPRFALYPALPQALLEGGAAIFEASWTKSGETAAKDSQPFRVEVFDEPVPRSGRVRLTVPNEAGAVLRGVPARLGVPFPRGVLAEADHLRLVNEDGAEVPMQAEETARWSKFGSVKWVLVGFAVDLDGGPRELFLEYGPDVRRAERAQIAVQPRDGFPSVDAGVLRFDRGLWYDAAGDGDFVKVLEERALRGAFVEHEDGRIYRVPADAEWTVEESGPEKVVLKGEGWYREEGEGREFCKYLIRWVIHRDSPVARVFHTWIFTGDGNRDRIANMGWEFDLPGGFERQGFRTSFGDGGEWADADYLLQWDYQNFDLVSGGQAREFPGGRSPGAAAAEGDGVRLHFGVRDFWQNYPSELEFRGGSLWFHNWPRHSKHARYSYDTDALARSEWKLNSVQLLFAHQGEVLDFRLPDEFAEGTIYQRTHRNVGYERHWEEGRPESANAQGVSRTEEMWLYLTPAEADAAPAVNVLEGLNEQTLRASVDPRWVARSGAFLDIHPLDKEQFPEEERVFDLVAHSPARLVERLGLYGMWIYGDLAAWVPGLSGRTPHLYRAFRKGHHGWPYSWIPYARSGDPALLRYADAATRQMIDANYCHYFDEEVAHRAPGRRYRAVGRWRRCLVPWAGGRGPMSRHYHDQSDYLWFSWYLTGYHRARDNALCWGEQTRNEEPLADRGPIRRIGGDRWGVTLLDSYMDMYQATFEPWFLVASHAIAEGHLHKYETENRRGHLWRPGDQKFLCFTGCEGDFLEYYMAYADYWGGHRDVGTWARFGTPVIHDNAYAWRLTGDDYYLARIAAAIHYGTHSVFDADEPDYFLGYTARDGGTAFTLFTSWHLHQFAVGLAALAEAGTRPPLIFKTFIQASADVQPTGDGAYLYRSPTVALKKEAGEPLALNLSMLLRPDRAREGEEYRYSILGPAGEEVLSGAWEISERERAVIPADAPAGVYLLRTEGESRDSPERFGRLRGLEVPVADAAVPEVIALEPGEPMGRGVWTSQYWFLVPEGVESFFIEFPVKQRLYELRRLSVWDPDGNLAWNRSFVTPGGEYDGENPIRAEIQVPPEHAGRLWHLTLPGRNAGFRMDPQIPPYYSTSPVRWFDPGVHRQ